MPAFDHRHHAHAQHAGNAAVEPVVGRSTLTEPHADDPSALERIYGDNHHDPHAKRFEPHEKHAEKHHAKVDDYNRHTIDDHATKHAAGRPGVELHDGVGLFTINKAEVTRYTFVRHRHTNVATPFDVIERDKITQTNWKVADHHPPSGKDVRLLANPSTPRMLNIEGKDHLCVLTWAGTASSAWMKVDDLVDGHQIAAVARSRGHREDPHATSHDPGKLLHQTKRYVIRNDGVGEMAPGDQTGSPNHEQDKVFGPGAKSGDDLPHYLTKDARKPGFAADGSQLGQDVTRSYVALCMNLPEGNTPPIALDTLLAGESFFAMRDSSFHRETPLFHNGKRHTNVLEVWVFGYAGMLDAHGRQMPDPARRGWVPLRVLADAKHLQLHDVPQR